MASYLYVLIIEEMAGAIEEKLVFHYSDFNIKMSMLEFPVIQNACLRFSMKL